MEHHIAERGILVVPVSTPAAGSQVHFHVADHGCGFAELQNGAAEIRPALDVGKTRVKHANALAVQGLKLVAAQPLLLPDGLEQSFRRRV